MREADLRVSLSARKEQWSAWDGALYLAAAIASREEGWSMIPKSVERFSEKIMLKQKDEPRV